MWGIHAIPDSVQWTRWMSCQIGPSHGWVRANLQYNSSAAPDTEITFPRVSVQLYDDPGWAERRNRICRIPFTLKIYIHLTFCLILLHLTLSTKGKVRFLGLSGCQGSSWMQHGKAPRTLKNKHHYPLHSAPTGPDFSWGNIFLQHLGYVSMLHRLHALEWSDNILDNKLKNQWGLLAATGTWESSVVAPQGSENSGLWALGSSLCRWELCQPPPGAGTKPRDVWGWNPCHKPWQVMGGRQQGGGSSPTGMGKAVDGVITCAPPYLLSDSCKPQEPFKKGSACTLMSGIPE